LSVAGRVSRCGDRCRGGRTGVSGCNRARSAAFPKPGRLSAALANRNCPGEGFVHRANLSRNCGHDGFRDTS
jgi:hypothetical protein